MYSRVGRNGGDICYTYAGRDWTAIYCYAQGPAHALMGRPMLP
jgi:hypothetical protein